MLTIYVTAVWLGWYNTAFTLLHSSDCLPSSLQVFRLSQLLIRYLLHSQERLTEAVATLQRSNEHMRKAIFFPIRH